MNTARKNTFNTTAMHGALILYTLIALFPVFVILINSFKSRRAIFKEPLALPDSESFSLIGYQTVMKQGDFFLYFQNSMIVTVASLFFILLFGAMAAFALSEYRFRGNLWMGLYLALGIMIPIRIGTVAILVRPLAPDPRYRIVTNWTRVALWLLKWICGIRCRVQGLEHVPSTPSVILCKHQSAWETMILQR